MPMMNMMNTTTSARMMTLPKLAMALTLLAGASVTLADVPKVLDRVPTDAALVATVGNIGGFQQKIEKWADSLGIVEDILASGGDNPLEALRSITGVAGLDKAGSAAVFSVKKPQNEIDALKAKAAAKAEETKKAIEDAAKAAAAAEPGAAADEAEMTDEEFNEDINADENEFDQTMDSFALVPVTDYAAFVKALGATSTEGIVEVNLNDEKAVASNLGNGYAIVGMSEDKAPLERVLAKAASLSGNMKTHEAALGANGKAIADGTDVMLIANIPALRADIEEGMKKAKEEAGNQTMPGMEGLGQFMDMMKMVGENFARDASVGIAGLGMGDNGLWIDIGTQFKDGTELSGLFQDKGDTNRLLSRVPDQDFLIATVMDTAAPGIKKMLTEYTKISTKMMEDAAKAGGQEAEMSKAMQRLMGPFSDMTAYADKTDGYAMVMGATPGGLMGGLFVNTIAYSETKQPAVFTEAFKKALGGAGEGEKIGPITIKGTYKEGAATLADVKADQWGMQIIADPNDPEGQQVAMMSGFIFGPRGLGGYLAQVENGFITSYSDNKLLMTNAIEVAKSGKGLSMNADMQVAQSLLPKNRTLEFHIGVKPILETVQGFAGMMGGGGDWQVPEKVSPVSMGASTHSGGMHARIYVPNDVVTALKGMAKAFEGMGNPMGDEEPMDGDSPDF